MSILSKNYLYFEVILSRYTEKQSNYKILKFRVYLKTLKWCVFDIKYFNLTIHFYLGTYKSIMCINDIFRDTSGFATTLVVVQRHCNEKFCFKNISYFRCK